LKFLEPKGKGEDIDSLVFVLFTKLVRDGVLERIKRKWQSGAFMGYQRDKAAIGEWHSMPFPLSSPHYSLFAFHFSLINAHTPLGRKRKAHKPPPHFALQGLGASPWIRGRHEQDG